MSVSLDDADLSPRTKQKKRVEWAAKMQTQRQGGEFERWVDEMTPVGKAFDDKFLTKEGYKHVADYDYKSPDGHPLYQSRKYRHKHVPDAKLFIQRRKDPDVPGVWIFGAGPLRVPYRWPGLVADTTSPVYLCEGEKDADRVASLGLVATTVAGGKHLSDTVLEALRGRDVIILQDNDEPGQKLAADRADKLQGVSKSTRVVLLPGLKHKGDVSDWLDAGKTKEDLVEIAMGTAASGPRLPIIDVASWEGKEVPQQEWAVPDRVPVGNTTLFSGEGAAGKSLIMLQQTAAHVLGAQHHGVAVRQGPAIFIDAEDGEGVMHKRLADVLRHYGASFSDVADRGLRIVSLVGRDAVLGSFNRSNYKIEPTPLYHELLDVAERLKPAMITIASSANVFGGSEIDRTQVMQFVALLTRMAQVGNSGLVLISHPSLTGISTDSGLSGSTQWHNACRARLYIKGVRAGRGDDETVDTNLRTVEYRKNNYGPVSDTVTVRYTDGLFLPVAQSEADPAVKAALADDMFLAVMTKLVGQGQDLVEAVNSPASASTKISNHPTARAFTKDDMEKAKQRLLDADKIHIADSSGPPSKVKKILKPGPAPTFG